MIKLKDTIPFEQLEKLGFKYNDDNGQYVYRDDKNPIGWVTINVWNRHMSVVHATDNILDLLVTLISTGFIEKL